MDWVRDRRVHWAFLGVVIVALLSLGAWLVSNDQSADSPTTGPGSSTSSTGATAEDEPADPTDSDTADPTGSAPSGSGAGDALAAVPAAESAESAGEALIGQWTALSPQDSASLDLSIIAGELVQAEFASLASEYSDHGWTRSGTPMVVWTEVVDETQATATVHACIDATNVVVTDAGGNVASEGQPPTLTIYHLSQDGDRWVLDSFTFPDDPDCAER